MNFEEITLQTEITITKLMQVSKNDASLKITIN